MTRNAHVALVTCFHEDETVNYAATRAQVRRQLAAGNDLMVCGTNGDFSALTHDEKIRLVGEVMEEVAGRAKVIANVGCPATFETLQLARAVDGMGLHGIAVIAPYFISLHAGRADPALLDRRRCRDDAGLSLRHPGPHPEPYRACHGGHARPSWQHRGDQGFRRLDRHGARLSRRGARCGGVRSLLRARPSGALGPRGRLRGRRLGARQRGSGPAGADHRGLQRGRHGGRARRRKTLRACGRTSMPWASRRRSSSARSI